MSKRDWDVRIPTQKEQERMNAGKPAQPRLGDGDGCGTVLLVSIAIPTLLAIVARVVAAVLA